MIVHEERPFNAEPPLVRPRQSFLTPKDLFFSRNHGSIPELDPEGYRLVVGGLVDRPLELSMGDLYGLPKMEVVAVLQCAGNRRNGLMQVAPIPGETPWRAGAIGNASWAGVPLREVLSKAGIGEEASHAAFVGLDEVEGEGGSFNYGGSIPLEKALSPEVILAYEINGEPLPREHGFPLRVVAPGRRKDVGPCGPAGRRGRVLGLESLGGAPRDRLRRTPHRRPGAGLLGRHATGDGRGGVELQGLRQQLLARGGDERTMIFRRKPESTGCTPR